MLPARLLPPALLALLVGGGGWLLLRGGGTTVRPAPVAGVVPPTRAWRLAPEAVLVEDGTPMPVRLSHEISDGQARLTLTAAGRTLDREAYALNGGAVALAEGADERYRPPIPLVTKAPGSWGWKGTMEGHGAPMPAEARVVARPASFALGGASFPAVESLVTLTFGEDAKSGRTLRTVYVPGRGVVHREFGTSVRTVAGGRR